MPDTKIVLPDNYIRLEYLHKTGAAWANSLINQKDGIGVKVTARFTVFDGTYQYLIGSYVSNDFIGIWKQSQSLIELCYKENNVGHTLVDINNFHTFSINYKNDRKFIADGEIIGVVEETKEATTPAIYIGDTTTGLHFDSEFDIGIVEITDGEDVIAQLIPSVRKTDSKVGFYDLVREEFYYNEQGTGTFTIGAIISDDVIREIKVDQTIYDIQSKSVENKNLSNTDLPSTFDWVGTLSEYQAQSVEQEHPDWLCYITDDIHDEDGSIDLGEYMKNGVDQTISGEKTFTDTVKSPTPNANTNDTTISTTEWVNSKITSILTILYPVGSLYIGTQTTCPLINLIPGSSWEIVGEGKALWGGNGSNANNSISAGLPNITGSLTNQHVRSFISGSYTNDSALYRGGNQNGYTGNYYESTAGQGLYFDASRSNSIYGNSNTVQPPAYVANIWRRIS